MNIGWISATIYGESINLENEEDLLLLPMPKEEMALFLEKHPDADIFDLQENENRFLDVFNRLRCCIFDVISVDCSIKELNDFLNAACEMKEKEFEDCIFPLLIKRKSAITPEDMMKAVDITM